jgi:hypothetical protein
MYKQFYKVLKDMKNIMLQFKTPFKKQSSAMQVSQDEDCLDVIKAVAQEVIFVTETSQWTCGFCPGEQYSQEERITDFVRHWPDCKTVVARQALKNLGTPLCLYRVEAEVLQGKEWIPRIQFIAAFCKETVTAIFDGNERRRNTSIVKLKEL